MAEIEAGNSLLNFRSFQVDERVSNLFPLPLVSFETMMVLEDRKDYPMLARLDLEFSGQVDWQAMSHAITSAVVRHPLLYALLEKTRFGNFRWVMPSQPGISITILKKHSTDSLDAVQGQWRSPIDLQAHPGVRFLLIESEAGLKLSICVHHACTDGIGLLQLVEDILAIYQQQTSKQEDQPELRPLDFKLLEKRGKFPIESIGWSKRIKDFLFAFQLAHRFGRDKPDPIATTDRDDKLERISETDQAVDETGEGNFTELLIPLRKASARAGVTLNDLLILGLFLTIQQWNARSETGKSDSRYRILMPCNLRGPAHLAMPAANRMSYSFLSRSLADLKDEDALLAGIRGETEYIRTENASMYFIRSLQVAERIPGGMSSVANANQCQSTALLSNLGDPTLLFVIPFNRIAGKIAVGNLVLERLRPRSPLRPLTHLGIVVSTYANQLLIGTAFDQQLSQSQVAAFLDMYRNRLRQIADKQARASSE
jgi:hypothetical protein